MAKRKPNLSGTNLHVDSRTGNYIWRRVHEVSGKRLKRSTRTKILRVALRRAQEFEDEYQRELVGLSANESYRKPLEPLIGGFLISLNCGYRRRELLEMQVRRALERFSDWYSVHS